MQHPPASLNDGLNNIRKLTLNSPPPPPPLINTTAAASHHCHYHHHHLAPDSDAQLHTNGVTRGNASPRGRRVSVRAAANMWSACDAATLPDRATIFVALTKSTIRNSTKSGVERWKMWKYFKKQIYMNSSIHTHM